MGNSLPMRRAARRGMTSMLAMMYLVLFAVLAVGFYASTGSNAQVSHNEKRRYLALGAAESGMDFMRFQLFQVAVPPTTPDLNILTEIYNDLAAQINNTPNMKNMSIVLDGKGQIQVPGGSESYIKLAGDGSKFRAVISRVANSRLICVKVIGAYSDSTTAASDRAAVQLIYEPSERPTKFFDTGMAARGAVTIDTKSPIAGTPASEASILTTTAVNPPVTVSSGSISGDITELSGTTPSISGGTSVGGSSIQADILANHVHYMDPSATPEFPTPNTAVYAQFATTAYVPGKASYDNVYIPANMNPTIGGPITFRGVILVKAPNQVKFNGNVTIQGTIVSENNGVGTLASNVLTFTGSGNTTSGVESLPDVDPFKALRLMGGSFVIAPGFDIKFTGNFDAIAGNVVGDRITVQGSSDLNISGSMVALKSTLTLGTNGVITFKPNASGMHTGLRFSDRFVPQTATYDEVKPQ